MIALNEDYTLVGVKKGSGFRGRLQASSESKNAVILSVVNLRLSDSLGAGAPFDTFDIILSVGEDHLYKDAPAIEDLKWHVSTTHSQLQHLHTLIDALQSTNKESIDSSSAVGIKVILPAQSGQIIRSDILEVRLECCPVVKRITSFLSPLQVLSAQKLTSVTSSSLLDQLSSAIGIVEVHSGRTEVVRSALDNLQHDLVERLSFPWIAPSPIARKRIAWVQGRENHASIGRAYQAAKALGITLVILDEPGHWLEDDDGPYAALREAFIPISIDIDEGLAERVVNAVRSYPLPIDGIVTVSDVRLHAIAEACETLGLPTSPSISHAIAEDKFQTRELEVGNDRSFLLNHESELARLLDQGANGNTLQYPLIVKPCRGWNSDCVAKVNSEQELVAAVRKASDRHKDATRPSTSVIIEPYIDGPEVDINLVLLDGEVLFFEVNDDFPSTADTLQNDESSISPPLLLSSHKPEVASNFQETQQVIPSALPASEIELLKMSVHASILRQGFRSGIFHCEARVRNSSVEYRTVRPAKDTETEHEVKIVDLHAKYMSSSTPTTTATANPTVYLHEINARPPGYIISVAVQLSWGIDYYALRLLYALLPPQPQSQLTPSLTTSSERTTHSPDVHAFRAALSTRINALSRPYKSGPQFATLSAVMIPQKTQKPGSIMKTTDAAGSFLAANPSIREYVVDHRTHLDKGSVLEGSAASALWWVAHFAVAVGVGGGVDVVGENAIRDRQIGRRRCLELAGWIAETFDYEVDEEGEKK